MIRLCRKTIQILDIKEADNFGISDFFERHENNGAIVVYEFEKMKGVITYSNYKNNQGKVKLDERKVVIGKTVWEEAHGLFNKDKDLVLLSVTNKDDRVVCFCYNNKKADYNYFSIDRILDYYEKNTGVFFMRDLYPWMREVRIYGVNEWSFRLYQLLSVRNIPVSVYGEYWEYFGVVSDGTVSNDYEIFNVYSEGISNGYQGNVFNEFSFLSRIATINKQLLGYQLRDKYKSRYENLIICQIPEFEDLEKTSIDEKIRNRLKIFPEQLYKDEIEIEQYKKVAGVGPEKFIEQKRLEKLKIDEFFSAVNGISTVKIGGGV